MKGRGFGDDVLDSGLPALCMDAPPYIRLPKLIKTAFFTAVPVWEVRIADVLRGTGFRKG